MKTTLRPATAILLALLTVVAAGCSAAPDAQSDPASAEGAAEPTESVGAPILTSTIVSRADQWVTAKLHYCQAAYDKVDSDSACWAWEGSSHLCRRTSNAAWNAYRSDCSGFVTWAWGLPVVGSGGYTTYDFAPHSTAFSHVINGSSLRAGDALNVYNEHIILFKKWVGTNEAVFIEEPGCSSSTPYAHEFTSHVEISGSSVHVDYEGMTFVAIRFNGSAT